MGKERRRTKEGKKLRGNELGGEREEEARRGKRKREDGIEKNKSKEGKWKGRR